MVRMKIKIYFCKCGAKIGFSNVVVEVSTLTMSKTTSYNVNIFSREITVIKKITQNSIFCRGTDVFNKLNDDFKNDTDIEKFKTGLREYVFENVLELFYSFGSYAFVCSSPSLHENASTKVPSTQV